MQSRRTLTLTLPFTKGEGNLRWHRVRVTEQGSETGAFSPLPARSGERIKVRGASDCILSAQGLFVASDFAFRPEAKEFLCALEVLSRPKKIALFFTANQRSSALIRLEFEFPLVPLQQGLRVVWQEINFAMKFLGFTRLQSANVRVVVQADNHALK